MNRIKEIRKQKGFTLEKLSEKLNLAPSTISQYETNKRQASYETLEAISKFFGVSIDYLLGVSSQIDIDVDTHTKITKLNTVKIPVVGEIRAGLPTFADENILDYEEVTAEMLNDGELFGLKVKGDSMLPRILDGDVVIVRKQSTANSGDICVVLVNGDSATLKKVKFVENGIMLIPSNQCYETMFYSKQDILNLPVQIIGKVIELRGKF